MSTTSSADCTAARTDLDSAWEKLNSIKKGERPVNFTSAVNWLKKGESAIGPDKPDCTSARYCAARAWYELGKAEEAARHYLLGYLAILIEFIYIGVIVWLFVSVLASGGTLAGLTNTKVFQVPVFVILWGFLGGVAWCLYGAAYWSNRRLFDSHYFPWYIAHPWISAVLGAVMALLILGGLSSLGTFDPTTDVGVALLSVVSFVAGFSTHKFWKLLDRSVAKLLGEKESERTIQEEAEKALTPSKP